MIVCVRCINARFRSRTAAAAPCQSPHVRQSTDSRSESRDSPTQAERLEGQHEGRPLGGEHRSLRKRRPRPARPPDSHGTTCPSAGELRAQSELGLLEEGVRVPHAASHRRFRELREICRRGLRSSKAAGLPPKTAWLLTTRSTGNAEILSLVQCEPAAGD